MDKSKPDDSKTIFTVDKDGDLLIGIKQGNGETFGVGITAEQVPAFIKWLQERFPQVGDTDAPGYSESGE